MFIKRFRGSSVETGSRIFFAHNRCVSTDIGQEHRRNIKSYRFTIRFQCAEVSLQRNQLHTRDGDHEKDPNIPIPTRPTTGDLDVQVEVVNWGQVSQDAIVQTAKEAKNKFLNFIIIIRLICSTLNIYPMCWPIRSIIMMLPS